MSCLISCFNHLPAPDRLHVTGFVGYEMYLITLKVVDRILRAVHTVVDDEGLSLALETLLRDNLDNVAKLIEESVERLDQGRDLDVLVEVASLLCFCQRLE